MSRAGANAIATGLIVHEVLERLEAEGVDLAQLIEDAIADHDSDAPEPDDPAGIAYRAYVRARIDAATASPVWQSIAKLPSARRELPFTRLFADGTTINGALDLVARDGDAVRVLDVKTSGADAGVLGGALRGAGGDVHGCRAGDWRRGRGDVHVADGAGGSGG